MRTSSRRYYLNTRVAAHESPSVRTSFSHGFVAEFGVSVIMQAWRSGAPLPRWTRGADEDPPLGGLSQDCTRIVAFYGSPRRRRKLRVKDAEDRTVIADLFLGDDA